MSFVEEVDPERIACDVNLFQSAFWARFKKNRGYEIQAFRIGLEQVEFPLVLVYRPCGSQSVFGYVPHGPDIDIDEERQGPFLESVSERIRHRLSDHCRFLRFDLPWPSPYEHPCDGDRTPEARPEPRVRELRMNFGCRRWNLRKAPTDMQAPDTVIIDLSPSPGQILKKMHKKARYCIRSSHRRGVAVRRCGPEALPDWHGLYLEMADRKGIDAERLSYFRQLFTSICDSCGPDIRLYLAYRNHRLLAGSLFAFHRRSGQATYLFSASSPEGRVHMAAYALLWQAICDARTYGCRWFDLFGIPSAGTPEHPMYGLYRFKTRFGGRIRHFRGCWDYPFDEKRYPMLAFAGL